PNQAATRSSFRYDSDATGAAADGLLVEQRAYDSCNANAAKLLSLDQFDYGQSVAGATVFLTGTTGERIVRNRLGSPVHTSYEYDGANQETAWWHSTRTEYAYLDDTTFPVTISVTGITTPGAAPGTGNDSSPLPTQPAGYETRVTSIGYSRHPNLDGSSYLI